jgi:hypothetical protein
MTSKSSIGRLLLPFVAVAAAACFATPCFADETKPADTKTDTYNTTSTKDGYTVTFVDDLLQGGGIDGSAPIIKVRPRAARSTLIQPRLQFVQELYATIENL